MPPRKMDAPFFLNRYERRLRLMAQRARQKGVPIMFCLLPANVRDVAPRGSPRWDTDTFIEAWRLFEAHRYTSAIKKFKTHLVRYPDDVFGYYFLAQCYDSLRAYTKARFFYRRGIYLSCARGNVYLPVEWRRQVGRRLCAEYGVPLADLERSFQRVAAEGIIGVSVLCDECHWWGEYNSLVEDTLVDAIIAYNRQQPAHAILAPASEWDYSKWHPEQFDYSANDIFFKRGFGP